MLIMNEDFVPYELAVKLKENGFDYPCIAHYNMTKELKVVLREPIFWHSDVLSYTDAPTISQVLEWLRKEKEIHITIEFFRFNGNTELWWTYTIRYINNDDTENIFEDCKRETYEEATLAGIEYVIDNLI